MEAPKRRFIATPDKITESTVTLTGCEARHISTTLRLKRGSRILVTGDVKNQLICSITRVLKNEVVAEIVERLPLSKSSLPAITLAQALPKGRKMDDIVRMACEIGVERIAPVIAERCIVRLNKESSAKKMERWRSIAQSAAKQSGADFPALLFDPMPISDLAESASEELKIALLENESRSLKSLLTSQNPSLSSINILAGPEGGLTDTEAQKLRSCGFETASLGSKILRTETAGIVALSAIVYQFCDLASGRDA